jgi:hypothetical protein
MAQAVAYRTLDDKATGETVAAIVQDSTGTWHLQATLGGECIAHFPNEKAAMAGAETYATLKALGIGDMFPSNN